ncbi:hypothetical protein M9Y10_008757 [Tritrichomonas musculus]|uniref:Uncharacterized protein n=1 Tax=Tritrichomonas musculus TaxID=1915356 RepID=A0ABR2IYZ3_9EUKA
MSEEGINDSQSFNTTLGSEPFYSEVSDNGNENDKLNVGKANVLSSGLNKSEMKRLKWNEYMRNYNAKKRKEQKERLHKVMFNVGGKEKLYEEADIGNILIDSINIFIQILNDNNVFDDRTLAFTFIACRDDIVKMYELILPLINQLINPQTDNVSGSNRNLNYQSDYRTTSNFQPYQTNNVYK